MSEFMYLLVAIAEGALLGVFFFAGLYWTVRQLGSSKQVALLFFASMMIRTSVVILGFYFILGDNWQRLLAGLLGFVMARMLITLLTRTAARVQPLLRKTANES